MTQLTHSTYIITYIHITRITHPTYITHIWLTIQMGHKPVRQCVVATPDTMTEARQQHHLTTPNQCQPIRIKSGATDSTVTVHQQTHLCPTANQIVTRISVGKTTSPLSTNQKPRKCHDPISTQMRLPKPNKWSELCRAEQLCNHKCRKCRNKSHARDWSEPYKEEIFY